MHCFISVFLCMCDSLTLFKPGSFMYETLTFTFYTADILSYILEDFVLDLSCFKFVIQKGFTFSS